MADGEKKKGGMLSKVFWGAVTLATVGIGGEIAWEMLLEPVFFEPIHNYHMYENMTAWKGLTDNYLGWIPSALGLTTTEGGLLNQQWAQAILEPYKGVDYNKMVEAAKNVAPAQDISNMSKDAMMAEIMAGMGG